MKNFSTEHIILLVCTIIFLVASCYGVSKLKKKAQNVVFIVTAVLGSGGLFFRYAMGMKLTFDFKFDTLFIQTLQVCNFNFILLPLMLIKRFELARQYSIFFSMIAASTVMLSIPGSYQNNNWYDITVLNFWFNHVFAVALPLYMLSSGRYKPNIRYIIPVTVCVVAYFVSVYFITAILWNKGLLSKNTSFSYVYDPKGMLLLTQFYNLFGQRPLVHLFPVIPIIMGIFYLFTLPFTKKVYVNHGEKVKKLYGARGYKIKLKSFKNERLLGYAETENGEIKYLPNEKITVTKKNLTLYAILDKTDQ